MLKVHDTSIASKASGTAEASLGPFRRAKRLASFETVGISAANTYDMEREVSLEMHQCCTWGVVLEGAVLCQVGLAGLLVLELEPFLAGPPWFGCSMGGKGVGIELTQVRFLNEGCGDMRGLWGFLHWYDAEGSHQATPPTLQNR